MDNMMVLLYLVHTAVAISFQMDAHQPVRILCLVFGQALPGILQGIFQE